MMECIFDYLGDLRISQDARAAPCVEQSFVAFRKKMVIFKNLSRTQVFEIMGSFPAFAFCPNLGHDGSGKRIGETEGDKIPNGPLFPMGQITAGSNIDFRVWIKKLPKG